jgi:hypothetical protein
MKLDDVLKIWTPIQGQWSIQLGSLPDQLRREKTYTLTYYGSKISTVNLKLEMTVCAIRNC